VQRQLEPEQNGQIDTERLEVLQEMFSACFEPATVIGKGVWEIRLLESTFGYISRIGVNYVFATLGYLSEEYKSELEAALCRRGPEKGLYTLPIKAKMSPKLLNKLVRISYSRGSHLSMDTVVAIEEHTGVTLHKTRDYIKKYE